MSSQGSDNQGWERRGAASWQSESCGSWIRRKNQCVEQNSWREEWKRVFRVVYLRCSSYEHIITMKRNWILSSLMCRTCSMGRTSGLCFEPSHTSVPVARIVPLTAITNGTNWWCVTWRGQVTSCISRRWDCSILLSGIRQANGRAVMLWHLIVESRENQSKQGMYELDFNLIVIYLIERENNKKRINEGKEKDRHSHFQLASANIDWHQRCQKLLYNIVVYGWCSPILIDTKGVRQLLYNIVISSWHSPILIDTKDARRLLYIYGNRVDVVGFERNLDISRETLINTFSNGNYYWVTFTGVIGPIGLVRILIFPHSLNQFQSDFTIPWGTICGIGILLMEEL